MLHLPAVVIERIALVDLGERDAWTGCRHAMFKLRMLGHHGVKAAADEARTIVTGRGGEGILNDGVHNAIVFGDGRWFANVWDGAASSNLFYKIARFDSVGPATKVLARGLTGPQLTDFAEHAMTYSADAVLRLLLRQKFAPADALGLLGFAAEAQQTGHVRALLASLDYSADGLYGLLLRHISSPRRHLDVVALLALDPRQGPAAALRHCRQIKPKDDAALLHAINCLETRAAPE